MNRARSSLFLLPLLLCTAGRSDGQSDGAAKVPTPIFIELFTSEGCSSCPPADAWIKQLDATQPIPGAQAIVLSEHVDYWNHDGWTDPYSSSFFTDRQSDYVRAMAGSSPYTPEIVVNGRAELYLSDRVEAEHTLLSAAKAEQLPVRITALGIDGSPAVLHAHIDVDGAGSKQSADVYAVAALDHAESQVLHGENGGRRLAHASVAMEMVRIGKLEKGKTFSRDFQIKLKNGADAKNVRLIVFVQEPGPGAVLGAALREVSEAAGAGVQAARNLR